MKHRLLSWIAWWLGVGLQAMVLGTLLALALIVVTSSTGAGRVFRYESF